MPEPERFDKQDKRGIKQLLFIWLVLLTGMIIAFILCTQTSTSFAVNMFDTLGLSVSPSGIMNMNAQNLPVLTHWWGGITFTIGTLWFFAFIAFTLIVILLGFGIVSGLDKLGERG